MNGRSRVWSGLLGLTLFACATLSTEPWAPAVTPTRLPPGLFAAPGTAVAYEVAGPRSPRYREVRFPLGALPRDAGGQDVLLFAHANGRRWPVPSRRDGDAVVANVTPGLVYIAAAKPTGGAATTLDFICRLQRASEDKPDRRTMLPKICTQILCAPDVVSQQALLQQFGEPGLSGIVGPRTLGGWKVIPDDLCWQCTSLGPGSADISLLTMQCFPRGGAGCAAGSVLFSDNFETDTVGSLPAASPNGAPVDDRVETSGSVTVVSLAPFGRAARVSRTTQPSRLDAILGAGAQATGSHCVSFRGLTETGDTDVEISLLDTSGRAAWNLHIGSSGSWIATGLGGHVLADVLAMVPPHQFRFELDLDAGHFNMAVDEASVLVGHPLLRSDFTVPARLRFQYIPAILEAFPGVYVVDDIVIRKSS